MRHDIRTEIDIEAPPEEVWPHLVQRESFRGLLVRPLRRSLDGGTRTGFEAMNAALRRRVREAHPAA
jgi:hypothetical protein